MPAKLVAKIHKGEYIDMSELLRNNMELERRKLEVSDSKNNPASRREVPDLLSWITCFGTYSSVVCAKSPERARPLFAYQTITVREARRCGGTSWLLYDSTFRQQVTGKPNVDWFVLNASLYILHLLSGKPEQSSEDLQVLSRD